MKEHFETHDENKVVTLITSFMVLCALLFYGLDIALQSLYTGHNLWFLIASLLLLLLHKGFKINHTNVLCFLLFLAWISFKTWERPEYDMIKIYYIIAFGSSHLLFRERKIRWGLGLFVLFVYLSLFEIKFGVFFSAFDFKKFYEFIHILVCSAVVYFSVGYFRDQVEKYSDRQAQIIDETKNLNLSLEKRNSELKLAKESVEEKNKDLQTFSYIASHDLKTPLRTIISFQQLLKRKLVAQGSYEELAEYIDLPIESATSLQETLAKLLEFTRASKTYKFNKKNVNLYELAEKIKLEQLNVWGDEKVDIMLKLQTAYIYCDEEILYIILQNLVNNGLKYNKSEKPRVTISSSKNTDYTFIRISDNGIGIKEQFYKNIFEPFVRLVGESEFKGSGLGLAIVNRLVQQLDGEISIDSTIGKGSTFTLRFGNRVG